MGLECILNGAASIFPTTDKLNIAWDFKPFECRIFQSAEANWQTQITNGSNSSFFGPLEADTEANSAPPQPLTNVGGWKSRTPTDVEYL